MVSNCDTVVRLRLIATTGSFAQGASERFPIKPAGDAGLPCARSADVVAIGGGNHMMRPKLRIFRGDDAVVTAPEPEVTVPLGDILRVLEDAVRWDRAWLQDFADDEVRISADLHEIITAYSDMRPSA